MKIEWRVNGEYPDLHEAFVESVMVGWVNKRPEYCDRGHWQAQVEWAGIDHQDAFPRYFMRYETAVQEMEDFLRWRLERIPAEQSGDTYISPEQGWTCFHCGETFKHSVHARIHFGETPAAKPGCLIGNERRLLSKIRGLERQLAFTGEPVYLREVDAGTDNACWVICAKGDPGSVAFRR